MQIYKSALKHYPKEAIDEVLEFYKQSGMIRKDVVGYVGFYNGELLEVFIDISEGYAVFHCTEATSDTLKVVK
jgi:hypothetical protein